MSELALKLGSIVTTVLVMVGGYGYAATHLKNPNAPLQPTVEKSAVEKSAVATPAWEDLLRWQKSTVDNPTNVSDQGEVERLISPAQRNAILKFEKIFADFKLKLPWITEMLIATSRWFVKYWYIIPLIPVAIWLMFKLIRLNRTGGG